jgi:hypothetical protein
MYQPEGRKPAALSLSKPLQLPFNNKKRIDIGEIK